MSYINTTNIVVSIIIYIISAIANWKIFTKADVEGWKGLIPFYNGYILYKISWKTVYFFLTYILVFAGSIITNLTSLPTLIALILYIAWAVISVTEQYKLAKAFGHGIGFTIGLILLNPIFMLILGFDKSEYVGNNG